MAAVVFGSLFALLFIEGGASLTGQLKVALNWSLSIASTLLLMLLVYHSSRVLSEELAEGQFALLDVKPAGRWRVLLGKWLGLALLSGWLLLLIGCLTYGGLYWIAQRSVQRVVEGSEALDRRADLDEAYQSFFVSRRSMRPQLLDMEDEIEQYRKRLRERGVLKPGQHSNPALDDYIRQVLQLRLLPIDYRASRMFEFDGLPAYDSRHPDLVVRYKLFGRRDGATADMLTHRWELGNRSNGTVMQLDQRSRAGASAEFIQSARSVGPDGRLQLRITNLSSGSPGKSPVKIIVPAGRGIEVLVPAGSFGVNLIRGLLLIWIRLIMVAGIGIGASTMLRGQVTAFLLLGVLVVGVLNGFVVELLDPQTKSLDQLERLAAGVDESDASSVLVRVSRSFEAILPPLVRAMPNFDETDPIPDLTLGREVSWWRLLRQAFRDIGLRAGLFIASGAWLFSRREVGLPSL